MIKNISYEILNETKFTTDILLKFSGSEVTTGQYNSLNSQLDNFTLDEDSKCSLGIDMNYNEYYKILLIRLILTILDTPENVNLEQIINTHTYNFIEKYERNMKIYNDKLNK